MLKEVMLGSGGIMLAAAIFASSVAPKAEPAATAPVVAPPVVAAPVVTAPRPAIMFPEESGDVDFGAPMIETSPLDSLPIAPGPVEPGIDAGAPVFAAPDTAEANGGRQFNAIPGRPYPIPR